LSFKFITILPVNDAPEIFINGEIISYDRQDLFISDWSSFNGTVQINGSYDYGIVSTNGFLNLGLKFADSDAFEAPNIDFEIKIASKPEIKDYQKHLLNGQLSGMPKAARGTFKDDYIFFSGSIKQANKYISNLQFTSDINGDYQIIVTVWDNGNSGKFCPPPGVSTSTTCPRASTATLHISTLNNANLLTGVATGVGAGVLAIAAVGALLGAKYFKPTETEAWDDWGMRDMDDVAMTNPTFIQETVQGQSLIYQNSQNSLH